MEEELRKEKLDNEKTLVEFIDKFEEVGLPSKMSDKFWQVIEKNKKATPRTLRRAASLFFTAAHGMSVQAKAAGLRRNLPVDSVPREMIVHAINMIPSGSADFDRDLVIAACKNGMADLAAVLALLPEHITLALEIVAQHGVVASLKAAVADKCVQCLASQDSSLLCAAVRCLTGIGEAKRVPMKILRYMVTNTVEHVRKCGLAVGSAAVSHVEIEDDVIDAVISQRGDEFADTVLLSMCTSCHNALHVVNRIGYNESLDRKLALKILLISSCHEEVRPAVMVAMSRIDFGPLMAKWSHTIDCLTVLVSS